MRILTIATSYPRFRDDWAGRFVRDLNAGLTTLGHDVTTLAPWAPGLDRESDDGEAGCVLRIGDAGSAPLFYGSGAEANASMLGLPRAASAFLSATRAFTRALDGEFSRADLVLAHWAFPSAWWAASLPVGPPIVGVVHGADARFLLRPFAGRLVARRLRGRLDAVACVSAATRRALGARLGPAGREALILPMGVDPAVFGPSPSPVACEPRLVASAGRLVPSKGHDLLVEACAGLGVRMTIAGAGPRGAALARAANRLGVSLELAGFLSAPDLADLFRRAAVVVVPSRGRPGACVEGAPLVAIEALCCGAAVVGTETGGLPEVLGRGAVASASPRSLRRAIEAALAEPGPFRDPSAFRRFDRVAVAERLLTGIGAGSSRREAPRRPDAIPRGCAAPQGPG